MSFLNAMLGYAGDLSQEVVRRTNRARTKIDAGTYGPTEICSDALGFWITGVESWWNAALRPTSFALPTAFFNLNVGENDKVGPLPVQLTTAGALGVTDLFNVAGGTPIQATTHVGVKFAKHSDNSENRELIEVSLKDMSQHNGGTVPVPAGLYQGIAFVKDAALAHVIVRIT